MGFITVTYFGTEDILFPTMDLGNFISKSVRSNAFKKEKVWDWNNNKQVVIKLK